MSEETLRHFKTWFASYADTFKSEDTDLREKVILKEEHTRRTCKEIVDIGQKLGLRGEDLLLAEVTALSHDIGRFDQYARYRTFSDHRSVDHAELGARILREREILDALDESKRDLVLRAVSYHNRATLPQDETETCLFFSKLLRDADKLDILTIVTDYYHQSHGKPRDAVALDLPDTPEISDDVYRDMMERRLVSYTHLKTLNDFKLAQLAWIYDVNFAPTFIS